jgi:maltose/moltooligosaccharide transporter
MPYAMLSGAVNQKNGNDDGSFQHVYCNPSNYCCSWWHFFYKLIGDAHINAMILAGISYNCRIL